MPNIRPEDFVVHLDELHASGAKARATPDPAGRDPLARFLAVPNHAMFLFTSEDVTLNAYIRDHWAALDGLSGDICDIHVSLIQLQGLEDAYSQLNDIRSIRGLKTISPLILPALHVWSTDADLTFSLKDVDGGSDLLRNALRNVFGSMHSLGGPINESWVTEMRAWNASLTQQRMPSAQSVSGSVAARDIIQISNYYCYPTDTGDTAMSKSPIKPNEQRIDDVAAGGNISQTSESDESQTISRAQAVGNISQVKRKTAVMNFLGGTARGWGVVGLVIVLLAWIAYKYFSTIK